MGYLDNIRKQKELLKQVDPAYAAGKEQQGVIDTVYDLVDQTTRVRDKKDKY